MLGTWPEFSGLERTAVTHPVGSRLSRMQGGALDHQQAHRGTVSGLDQSIAPVDTTHGSP